MNHQEIWEECFSQFRLLGGLMQTILRNSATKRLVASGFEEVGSSDINHELFAMWNGSNGDWQKAALVEIDRHIRS